MVPPGLASALRQAQGDLLQKVAAETIGVKPSTYNRWVKALYLPDEEYVPGVATFLKRNSPEDVVKEFYPPWHRLHKVRWATVVDDPSRPVERAEFDALAARVEALEASSSLRQGPPP